MSEPRTIYGRKWSEKEYILVLYHYHKHKGEPQHADTPFVRELARVLGRTPHSILYRLQNFAAVDPDEESLSRKGKGHITEYGRRVFTEWTAKPLSLKDTAEAFLRDEQAQLEPDLFNPLPIRMPVAFKNRYELLDGIGEGGFGSVFSCLDTEAPYEKGERAIKIIHALRSYDEECRHRFAREIRALRALSHPNVIRIYDDNLDSEKDYPAFVMDLAECSLYAHITSVSEKNTSSARRPALRVAEAKEIILSILNATEALHRSSPQIIHRDINPMNILKLFDGRWVLADFSLAKFVPAAPVSVTFSTRSHGGMGTNHYTAPETWTNLKETDVRADVFALGWLVWDLLSGEGPYPRPHPSGLPKPIERVFLKATAYDRNERYESAREMHNDLDMCLKDL